MSKPVLPDWVFELNLQQQSVLLLALRGPDGVRKHHPCKAILRAYRGTILMAAFYGRMMYFGEDADTFMSLSRFADHNLWEEDLGAYFTNIDELPHHFINHMGHAAHIVAAHHPDERFKERWRRFYLRFVDDAHLSPETDEKMARRLGDWGQAHWE